MTETRVCIVEMAAPPASGKTTVLERSLTSASIGHLHHRRRLRGYREWARVGLLLRHLPVWWGCFMTLRPAVGVRTAGTRTAKYLTHLWRRGEEVRLGTHDLLIEDEAFINWAATDMAHCAPFREWFRTHVGLFYPPRWHGRRMEYRVLDLHCSELVRVQRILRRRLARSDPARAARQTRRNGLRSETLVTAREAAAIVRAQPGVLEIDALAFMEWVGAHRDGATQDPSGTDTGASSRSHVRTFGNSG